MKTLADFKRALTKGSRWYRKHAKEQEWRERIVLRVNSNHACVLDETGKEVVLDFPKAADFRINENGEAEIYLKGSERKELLLTYRKA